MFNANSAKKITPRYLIGAVETPQLDEKIGMMPQNFMVTDNSTYCRLTPPSTHREDIMKQDMDPYISCQFIKGRDTFKGGSSSEYAESTYKYPDRTYRYQDHTYRYLQVQIQQHQ
jgi:hypothetical protein